MIIKTLGRWAAIIAATVAGAILAHAISTTLWPPGHYEYADREITRVLTALGALAGFWFTHTGRLARLFRKV